MTAHKEIKEALLELVQDGELALELPPETTQDALRREKPLIRDLIDHAMQNGGFPANRVQELFDRNLGAYKEELKKHVDSHVENLKVHRMIVMRPDGKKIPTGVQHKTFKTLLSVLQAKLNAYLVGPAGSGKTTAAEQAANALGVKFYFTGAITSEYKLTGFIDAQGRVICPAFRKAYEYGGLFLFDEIDGSMPQAVLAFNAAIANGQMDFPDHTVKKHEDFYCVAAANTFGLGADQVYIGRNQLDGATLDRFCFIEWVYDEDLERSLSSNEKWTKHVQLVRSICGQLGVKKHVISPRASIEGSKLMAVGLKWEQAEDLKLWKGLEADTIKKIKANLPKDEPKKEKAPDSKKEAPKNAPNGKDQDEIVKKLVRDIFKSLPK